MKGPKRGVRQRSKECGSAVAWGMKRVFGLWMCACAALLDLHWLAFQVPWGTAAFAFLQNFAELRSCSGEEKHVS